MEWKIVTANPQVTRKTKQFAKCAVLATSAVKLALRTLVTAVTLRVLIVVVVVLFQPSDSTTYGLLFSMSFVL